MGKLPPRRKTAVGQVPLKQRAARGNFMRWPLVVVCFAFCGCSDAETGPPLARSSGPLASDARETNAVGTTGTVPRSLMDEYEAFGRIVTHYEDGAEWSLVPMSEGTQLLTLMHPKFVIVFGDDWLRLCGAERDVNSQMVAEIAAERIYKYGSRDDWGEVVEFLLEYYRTFAREPYDVTAAPVIRNFDHRTYIGDHVFEVVPRSTSSGKLVVVTIVHRDDYQDEAAGSDSSSQVWNADQMLRFGSNRLLFRSDR